MNALQLILKNRRYFGPVWVFTSLNIIIGTWVIYIPHVRKALEINDAQLGIALFFLSLGTLSMLPFAAKVINKLGVGKATILGIILFSLLFILPLAVDTFELLCFTLFLAGMGASLTDISMNALVSEIEQSENVHFMSAAHGFFSLGGVIGAGLGSLVIVYFKLPITHMLLTAVGVIITNLILARSYINVKSHSPSASTGKSSVNIFGPLVGLAVVAFIVMGSEGAIEHWSKLFMQDMVNVSSERLSGLAFVVFSATMTIGRFYGDQLSQKIGSMNLMIIGCIIAITGFITVLSISLITTTLGFGLIGLGLSVVIPELFRLAGKSKGIDSAKGISFVAGIGYVGFLLSPTLVGFLSNKQDLGLSFKVLLGSIFLVVLILIYLRSASNYKNT
jgi:fucose permease